MRKAKSYHPAIPDQFANTAWISSQELWITAHGILTDAGLRDHFGRGAVKMAMKVATKCDHLRFDHGNQKVMIIDALERKGLNLAVHPFRLNCFLSTMWRFSDQDIVNTFTVYGDPAMFYGWIENICKDVSNRDGQSYHRPSNMYGNTVQLDH
jgi:hypothetical protein